MENIENPDLKEIEKKIEEHRNTKSETSPSHQTMLSAEKHKLLSMSEIGLWLDTYDDIFSDFDPRPYSERALSDDFLFEAKKASKEKTSGKLELIFLIPAHLRRQEDEELIKKRLHEHFRKHYKMLEKELRHMRRNNEASIVLGVMIMLTATYLELIRQTHQDLILSFISVILEPAGWFFTWVGLERLLYGNTEKKNDLKFYEKMTKCDIVFLPY